MEQAQLEWRSKKVSKTAAAQDAAKASRGAGAPGVRHSAKQTATPASSKGLVMMLLDIVEQPNGHFHLWGTTPEGSSVLARVQDFEPYIYVAAPVQQAEGTPAGSEEDLRKLKSIWNRSLSGNARIQRIEPTTRKPIMFYRPEQPNGAAYLKVMLPPGGSMKKAGKAVHSAKPAVQAAGFQWEHADMHEHEVHLLQRFLVDVSLSAGCWVYLPAASAETGGWAPVPDQARVSTCSVEATVSWRAVQALTPDATQMADWSPAEVDTQQWREARALAVEGKIAPLRLLVLDVQLAPRDGKKRVAVAGTDPIVAITTFQSSSDAVFARDASQAVPGAGLRGEGPDATGDPGDEDAAEDIAVDAFPAPALELPTGGGEKVVMLWQKGANPAEHWDPGIAATIRLFPSEEAMLAAWLALLHDADPDGLVTFQVKDTLGALAERFKALRLEGGGLHISRAAPGRSHALALKRVVQYNPNWVKNQQRMASTSNQETFRADIDGRLVFDILRHVLTACNLASFSLSDCVHSLLGRTLEVLPADTLASLAALSPPAPQLSVAGKDSPLQVALRLARYSCAHAAAMQALLVRLSTIPETMELARATGLTAGQALYNAQMIRTHSLLLRTAQRTGFIMGGRQDTVQLQESPFLMHPVESNTVGLYRGPVAILDFASLYPSIFRAYNMSYDTLLHDSADAAALDPQDIFTTPTGDKFVKPHVREGILPIILSALIEARAVTKRLLKDTEDPAQRAVLSSRQQALKTTANAAYGFTGAQASPLQCVQLADSCLALGAASCRRAKMLLDDICSAGTLGPASKGSRVIYGQTDSIFCHFPEASGPEAICMAQQAAALVSDGFPALMEIKFERVCRPFMLLHVNRYAGQAFETVEAAEAGQGVLMVKGLKSMWRQAAPILRTTLQGVLQRIIMQENVPAAVEFVEQEVRRLLEGRCELSEMVMTGGLWRITGVLQLPYYPTLHDAPLRHSSRSQQIAQDVLIQRSVSRTGQQLEKAAQGASPEDSAEQRDKGRSFVLGERLQYVLLPGERLQDEAAEDPLTAALDNRMADCELYWRAKLQRPLQEVFATCLSHAALQALMSGPHTKVRVDHGLTSPEKPSKAARGALQTGLARFYKANVRCLACKRPIPKAELVGKEGREPGLCESCKQEEGTLARVHLSILAELGAAEHRHHMAHATCIRCHSGGLLGPVVCENGECPVLYSRLSAAQRLVTAVHNLERLDW